MAVGAGLWCGPPALNEGLLGVGACTLAPPGEVLRVSLPRAVTIGIGVTLR